MQSIAYLVVDKPHGMGYTKYTNIVHPSNTMYSLLLKVKSSDGNVSRETFTEKFGATPTVRIAERHNRNL